MIIRGSDMAFHHSVHAKGFTMQILRTYAVTYNSIGIRSAAPFFFASYYTMTGLMNRSYMQLLFNCFKCRTQLCINSGCDTVRASQTRVACMVIPSQQQHAPWTGQPVTRLCAAVKEKHCSCRHGESHEVHAWRCLQISIKQLRQF